MEVPYVIQISQLIVGRDIFLDDEPSFTTSRNQAD
jgi:hypothetical protein